MIYGARQAIKEEEERVRRAQRKAAAERKQRGAKIEKTKQYQDLYNKEIKKIGGYYSKGGKRENVSEVYLRNLDILKHKAIGKRRPLDMIDVFGRQ